MKDNIIQYIQNQDFNSEEAEKIYRVYSRKDINAFYLTKTDWFFILSVYANPIMMKKALEYKE